MLKKPNDIKLQAEDADRLLQREHIVWNCGSKQVLIFTDDTVKDFTPSHIKIAFDRWTQDAKEDKLSEFFGELVEVGLELRNAATSQHSQEFYEGGLVGFNALALRDLAAKPGKDRGR